MSRAIEAKTFTDRVFIAEVLSDHRLIDHRDLWRSLIILFVETSPHHQRDFHRFEEVGAYTLDVCVISATGRRLSINVCGINRRASAEQRVTGNSRSSHTGYRSDSLEHPRVEIGNLIRLVTAQSWASLEKQ